MEPITLNAETRDHVLLEWKQACDTLLRQVADWVRQEAHWSAEVYNREITEEGLGTYHVASLRIETPQGRLHLEPIARIVFGGTGTVELYAWPTLYRVRLLRDPEGSAWKVLTDSGIILRQPWNRDNFIMLAEDLLHAE